MYSTRRRLPSYSPASRRTRTRAPHGQAKAGRAPAQPGTARSPRRSSPRLALQTSRPRSTARTPDVLRGRLVAHRKLLVLAASSILSLSTMAPAISSDWKMSVQLAVVGLGLRDGIPVSVSISCAVIRTCRRLAARCLRARSRLRGRGRLADVDVAALDANEGRGATPPGAPAPARQVQQLFGHAVAEVVARRVTTKVGERQDAIRAVRFAA